MSTKTYSKIQFTQSQHICLNDMLKLEQWATMPSRKHASCIRSLEYTGNCETVEHCV